MIRTPRLRAILLLIALGSAILLAGRTAYFIGTIQHNRTMLQTLVNLGPLEPVNVFAGNCECARVLDNVPEDADRFLPSSRDRLSNPYFEAGRSHYYQGQYQEAISALQRAAQEGARDPLVDYFLGASYVCLDDGVQAAAYWKNEIVAWEAFKAAYRCRVADAQRRAETLYDLALTIQPQLAEEDYELPGAAAAYYLAAAGIARERNLPDTELHWLRVALEKYPRNPIVHVRLGDYYERLAELERANSYYRDAVSFAGPDDSGAVPNFIRTSFALGHWSEGAAAVAGFITGPKPKEKPQIEAVTRLIQQSLSPELCAEMNRALGGAIRPSGDDLQQMMANIQNVCTTAASTPPPLEQVPK